MAEFVLESLESIPLFLAANGRVYDYTDAVVRRIRVRDAREATLLLGPARRGGLRVTNYNRLDILATAGFMMEAAEMIIDDLLREVDSRSINREHVEGLGSNATFTRTRVRADSFFGFVDDVAQEMLSVVREMQGPSRRNYGQLHRSLENLRTSITNLRDLEVVFPSQMAHAPAPLFIDLSAGAGQPAATAPAPLVIDAPDAPAPKPEEEEEKAPAPKPEEEAPARKEKEEELRVDAPARKEEKAPEPKPKEEELRVDEPARKEEELRVDEPARKEEEAPKPDASALTAPKDGDAPWPKEEELLMDAATPASGFVAAPDKEKESSSDATGPSNASSAPGAAGDEDMA